MQDGEEKGTSTDVIQSFNLLLIKVEASVRYHARRQRFFDTFNNTTLFVVLVANTAAFADVFRQVTAASGLLVTVLVALILVTRVSERARDHNDLRRRFIELLQRITESRRQNDPSVLDSLDAARLEIKIDEPPINMIVYALCHNEVIKATVDSQETERSYLNVRFYHRVLGLFTRAFDDSLKWRPYRGPSSDR